MPAPRAWNPSRLDVAAFAAAGGSLDGGWPVATLPRLRDSQAPAAGNGDAVVRWRLAGSLAPLAGAGRPPCLAIGADTTVVLECQRCLQPMPVPLAVDRRVFFVAGEDAAAALDADSDDDVLALEPLVDAQALVEDELLLALPLVPRHDACPEPLPLGDAGADPAGHEPIEHPFAALAALKTRPS